MLVQMYVFIEYLALLPYRRQLFVGILPQASPYEICDGQSGTGTSLFKYFEFFPFSVIPLVLRLITHLRSYVGVFLKTLVVKSDIIRNGLLNWNGKWRKGSLCLKKIV